jgi:hypothetical protein
MLRCEESQAFYTAMQQKLWRLDEFPIAWNHVGRSTFVPLQSLAVSIGG